MSELQKVKIDITGLIAHGWTDKDEVFDTLLLASDCITELEQENQRLREALLEAADFIESTSETPITDSEVANKYRAIAQNKEY